MSGPKISVYTLSKEQRQWLLGQMRCEQQSLACAERILDLLTSCVEQLEACRTLCEQADLLHRRRGENSEEAALLQQTIEDCESSVSRIRAALAAHMPHISPRYDLTESAYMQKQQQLTLMKTLRAESEGIFKKLNDAVSQEQTHAQEKNDAIASRIYEDISGIYSFELPPEAPEVAFEEQKRTVFDKISRLAAQKLSVELLQSVQNALTSLDRIGTDAQLATFEAVTVKKLLRSAEAYRRQLTEKEEAFRDLLLRYGALCKTAGIDPLPFAPDGMEELAKEVEAMEQLLYKQQEQEYICECVDEIMSEMGYSLIGTRDVQKRNGKRFRNELYTFNEGTAVNVTYAADGQISMELGGLAGEDRIPTPQETEVLTEDMQAFCGEFKEFEQKLREKGIVLADRIALSPPSAEYAAIINLNDYALSENAAISELAVTEKHRRTAEKKQLRRND